MLAVENGVGSTLEEIRDRLTECPTCQGVMSLHGVTTAVMACKNPTHGKYVIYWSNADQRYYVNYQNMG